MRTARRARARACVLVGFFAVETCTKYYKSYQMRTGTSVKTANRQLCLLQGYHQTLQKRGQPLHEGFTIVKVRAARVACTCSLS